MICKTQSQVEGVSLSCQSYASHSIKVVCLATPCFVVVFLVAPQAVLLVGFMQTEVDAFRALMNEMDADIVKVRETVAKD